MILGPDGGYLAGPLYDEEGLYAELDPARLHEERQRFDALGTTTGPTSFGSTFPSDPS